MRYGMRPSPLSGRVSGRAPREQGVGGSARLSVTEVLRLDNWDLRVPRRYVLPHSVVRGTSARYEKAVVIAEAAASQRERKGARLRERSTACVRRCRRGLIRVAADVRGHLCRTLPLETKRLITAPTIVAASAPLASQAAPQAYPPST